MTSQAKLAASDVDAQKRSLIDSELVVNVMTCAALEGVATFEHHRCNGAGFAIGTLANGNLLCGGVEQAGIGLR